MSLSTLQVIGHTRTYYIVSIFLESWPCVKIVNYKKGTWSVKCLIVYCSELCTYVGEGMSPVTTYTKFQTCKVQRFEVNAPSWLGQVLGLNSFGGAIYLILSLESQKWEVGTWTQYFLTVRCMCLYGDTPPPEVYDVTVIYHNRHLIIK